MTRPKKRRLHMTRQANLSIVRNAGAPLFALQSLIALMLVPGIILAQGATGTGTFGGTVPTTVAITDVSNSNLAGTLGTFGTLTIGKSTLVTPTPLAFRLRGNAQYQLSADVTAMTGMTNGLATPDASTTAQSIKTGDVGFGFTTAIVKNGLSVVGGGNSPNRHDQIVTGYNVTGGWPTTTDGHTPAFTKTLHDIYNSTQILSGDRISASGDNSSDDNYLVVTLGVATLPQYVTPTVFSATVTLTISSVAGEGGGG
jgi:hypothetical protein